MPGLLQQHSHGHSGSRRYRSLAVLESPEGCLLSRVCFPWGLPSSSHRPRGRVVVQQAPAVVQQAPSPAGLLPCIPAGAGCNHPDGPLDVSVD